MITFYKNLSIGKKSIFLGGVLILTFFSILYLISFIRKEQLEKSSFTTYGVVEKISSNVRKSRTQKKDVVYFYFTINDTVYHKVESLILNDIKKLNININDCFEVKVAKTNYDNFKIDFEKRKDTIIDKLKYSKHIYNSEKHRRIIN